MKKKNFQLLTINKKVISTFSSKEIKGGTAAPGKSGPITRCNFSNCVCL
ncbi:hypothetical protein [uncultured Kordia sp.]|nr:hypothetical protein [uncultured Kordia sp.]